MVAVTNAARRPGAEQALDNGEVDLDGARQRALELAWQSFLARGHGGLHIGTPEVQRRGLSMTGPLPGPRGRFAELVHVRWLLDFGASGAVLAEQRRGIGEVYRQAGDPAVAGVLHQLRQHRAGLAQAMAAYERFAAGSAAR